MRLTVWCCLKSESYSVTHNSDQRRSLAETGTIPTEEENQPKYKKTEAQENAELDVPHGQEVDQKGQEESLLNSRDTNNVTAEANNAGEDSVDENALLNVKAEEEAKKLAEIEPKLNVEEE